MGHMWLYLYDTMLDIDTRTLDSRVIQALTVAVEGGLAIVSTLQRDLTFGILFIILLFLISFEGDLSAKFGFLFLRNYNVIIVNFVAVKRFE